MRLDKLISNRTVSRMSKSRYEKLRDHLLFATVTYCDSQGWNFEALERLSEEEVKRKLVTHWRMQEYELAKGLTASHRYLQIHIVNNTTEPVEDPDWPEELREYKTNDIPVAYLCHKHDIRPPSNSEGEAGQTSNLEDQQLFRITFGDGRN